MTAAMGTGRGDGWTPKFAYPSPSSLYPVQIYLCLPRELAPPGLTPLAPGIHYYHPLRHSLHSLPYHSFPFLTEKERELAAILVGDRSALGRIYSTEEANALMLMEAGALTEVLTSTPLRRHALSDQGKELTFEVGRVVDSLEAQHEKLLLDALHLQPDTHSFLRALVVSVLIDDSS